MWALAGNDRARRFYGAAGWSPDGAEPLDQLFGQTVRDVRYRKEFITEQS